MVNKPRVKFGMRSITLVLVALAATQVAILYGRTPRAPAVVKAGAHYKRVGVVDNGIPVSLDFARLPSCTFVVFMMPTCPTCEREAANWSHAFGDSGTWHGVIVSFGDWASSREFAAAHNLSAPLFAVEENRMDVVRALDVPAVPTLVVLGEGGVVRTVAGPGASLDSLARASACPRRVPRSSPTRTTATTGS